MKRILWWIVLSVSAALALMMAGCDEPNEPDVPQLPFKQIAFLPMTSVPRDVSASGNHVSIATNTEGMIVLDMTNAARPETLFVYDALPHDVQCTTTRIDALHHYVMVRSTSPYTEHGQIPLFDYTKPLATAYVTNVVGNGHYSDYALRATENTIHFWGADIGIDFKVVVFGICRASSDSAWRYCPQNGDVYFPTHAILNGFDISDSNMLAITLGQYGVHLHDGNTRLPIADFSTLGIAEDCAWKGQMLFVADRYRLTVVDVNVPDQPHIVASLMIPSADRLSSIAICGDYACILDSNDGIYIVDISDPLNPKYIQKFDMTEPSAIAVSGNRLYAVDESDGLLVFSR